MRYECITAKCFVNVPQQNALWVYHSKMLCECTTANASEPTRQVVGMPLRPRLHLIYSLFYSLFYWVDPIKKWIICGHTRKNWINKIIFIYSPPIIIHFPNKAWGAWFTFFIGYGQKFGVACLGLGTLPEDQATKETTSETVVKS